MVLEEVLDRINRAANTLDHMVAEAQASGRPIKAKPVAKVAALLNEAGDGMRMSLPECTCSMSEDGPEHGLDVNPDCVWHGREWGL